LGERVGIRAAQTTTPAFPATTFPFTPPQIVTLDDTLVENELEVEVLVPIIVVFVY
jgi:hypothetical protein